MSDVLALHRLYCFVYLILLRGFEMSKRLIYGPDAVMG